MGYLFVPLTPALSLGEILIGERGRPARSSARPRAELRAVTATGPIPCPRPSEPTARAALAAPEAGALPILILREGESSAVFWPYPRRSWPSQCALNMGSDILPLVENWRPGAME